MEKFEIDSLYNILVQLKEGNRKLDALNGLVKELITCQKTKNAILHTKIEDNYKKLG